MKNALLASLLAFCAAPPAHARIQTKTVEYKDGDVVLQGYAAWEDGFRDARPGVIVVHERKGHGPYARRRAEQLAKLGFTAFAVDMYGKGVYAKDHEEAGKLAGAFFGDRAAMRRRALRVFVQLVDPMNLTATSSRRSTAPRRRGTSASTTSSRRGAPTTRC